MNSVELRQKFLEFFEKRGHKIVPSSSLLPTDPSVLFTTAGMQQFKPYYLGEKSPWGPNVASCQKCIRTSDIDEVGDERHLTFFEMLGNFSFRGYFKEKAIELAYKFIAEELKLDIDYVTVFSPEKVTEGDWRKDVAEDKESYEIWKKYVPEEKIRKEGVDNFWGPTGEEGPCGPTTEIYVNGIEVWNIVFNEHIAGVLFQNTSEEQRGLFGPMQTGFKIDTISKIEGVDTGMGLERLAMVAQKVPTVYETDLFKPIMQMFSGSTNEKAKRIIADHARASVFLISDGVLPSNKDRGYILRRLLRRMAVQMRSFNVEISSVVSRVIEIYKGVYDLDEDKILSIIKEEVSKFNKTISNGLKEIEKRDRITGKDAFLLYETYGFPLEVLEEMHKVESREEFFVELKKHQELSKTASAGMFKGGLADHDPKTIKLHTAHHLLLAMLQELFGKSVKQRGSNINQERLRIDFSFDRKMTDGEKKKVEDMVNQKIADGLNVVKREMPKEEAEKIGAQMEFGVKYGNTVSVYFIEDKKGNIFSKEFCGGPHIKNTLELGKFKILKEEAVSSGVRRIKATLEK